MTNKSATTSADGPVKVDRHHAHDAKHTPGDKSGHVGERLDRHPGDGLPIHQGPKKAGGGGGWGALGDEVGGIRDIHHVADLDAEEAAVKAEAAKDVAEELHKHK